MLLYEPANGQNGNQDKNAGVHGAFVGRRRELLQFDAALSDAERGKGCCLLVSGEPGVGKTWLAGEFRRWAIPRGFRVAWGTSWEGGGAPPFWPWAGVIRKCVERWVPADVLDRFSADAAAVARLVPRLRNRVAAEERGAFDDTPASFGLLDATAALFRAIVAQTPLLIVLDDIHAADLPSLSLLRFVIRELRDARLVVVATYRDAELSRTPAELVGELGRDSKRIALRGLSEREVETLIARSVGRTPAKPFVETVYRRTGGNPFFVDELLRLVAMEGRAADEPDVLLPAARLPQQVREAVRRHLRPLPAETVRLLSIAAVLGEEFDCDVLDRLSRELAGGGARSSAGWRCCAELRAAAASGVIAEKPGTCARFAFRHALIRETLYEDLAADERVAAHRAAVAAIEALRGTDAPASRAQVAHHRQLAAGCRPTTAVVADPRAERPCVAAVGAQRSATATFRREGEFWTIDYAGSTLRLRDAKGLGYIAHLLGRPGQEVHATELVANGGAAGADCRPPAEGTAWRPDLGDAGVVLDRAAQSAYKRRLDELRAELAEADACHDVGRAARLRRETEMVVHELGRALGIGGRERRAGSHAERARVNATRAIAGALRRIRAHAAGNLADHLSRSIKTGTCCAYHPRERIAWQV